MFSKTNMFEWLFGNKKEIEQIKENTHKSFDSVKKDIISISGWIKHLDSEKNLQKKESENIKEILSSVKEEIEGLKNIVSMIGELKTNKVFKTPQKVLNKRTCVYAVQTGVQTGVQTLNFKQFSATEKAIIWVLLNTNMKLSYDDLAAMLGKERSTVRGQINAIKKKSEIIEEQIEQNGKKRLFISEKIKEIILKKQKVRVNYQKTEKKE